LYAENFANQCTGYSKVSNSVSKIHFIGVCIPAEEY